MSKLWSLLPAAILVAIYGWLTHEMLKSRAEAHVALTAESASHARLIAATARPTTPTEQLRSFVEHCGSSLMPNDLKIITPYSCRSDPGDGLDGPAIVRIFRDPENQPARVVCDKTGCSWGIRNGVGL